MPETRHDHDVWWMREAIALSTRCPPTEAAFSVGAILLDADGHELARGHSREGGDSTLHAEEAALAKLEDGRDLTGATMVSTLEPCSQRATPGRTPCADLIINHGISRVVIAWREPDLFVNCVGAELLRSHGIDLIELDELAADARAVNQHLTT